MSDALAAMELRAETAEIMLADVRGECERLAAEVEDLRKQLEELKGGALSSDPSDLVSEMMRMMSESIRFTDYGDQWVVKEIWRGDAKPVVPNRLPPMVRGSTWKITIYEDLPQMRYVIRAEHRDRKDANWNMVVDHREVLNPEYHRHVAEKFAGDCARRNGLMTREREYLRDSVRYELSRKFNMEGKWL